MKFLLRAAVCLIVVAALPAQAEGDAKAGQSKSAVCAACHGPDGNSVVAQWPKLAGQHPAYLERQLGLIKSGVRAVPEMAGIVATMPEKDLADVSAWFASQTIQPGVADEALVVVGERIYRAGNAKTGVPACMACHGPAGEGNPLAGYPSLAGQHSIYTAKMLTGFRSGTTWGEDDGSSETMSGVANELTDAEIVAVASYLQGLHRAK
jgi:cytochrome c553